MSDILGQALTDYVKGDKDAFLLIHTSYGEIETMPASVFFRDESYMPDLEKYMLSLCKGKVLDAGAGAGSHSLWLQEKGLEVTALDISPAAVHIMQQRGVRQAVCGDIFTYSGSRFNTILLIMNGIGIAQTVQNLRKLLKHLKKLLKPGGQILLDSCDISYLEEANIYTHYIGEVTYQFEYKNQKSAAFGWLYLDISTLHKIASEEGWHCQIIYEEDETYAARLVRV
ncbi:class I SAM-dependent methyltransferase [Rhodocytophaga rosea]|nr:class I SAM-dependent methyltransferase [Rhodocytophaga rosea]